MSKRWIFIFSILIVPVLIGIWELPIFHYSKPDDRGTYTITRCKVDSITYLIINTRSGTAVVNYTADSMEWVFLHQSTKSSDYGQDTAGTGKPK